MQGRKIYVDVKVKNLRRATKFYKDVLGLKLLVIAPTWTSLQANEGAQIHLNQNWGATAGLVGSAAFGSSPATCQKQ